MLGVSAQRTNPERGLIRRTLHLLMGVGVEGALDLPFVLYLAWHDAEFYGAVMYGLAAGVIARKAVRFGLYQPLVQHLGRPDADPTHQVLGRVAAFRLLLLAGCLTVAALASFWMPVGLACLTLVMVAGLGLEGVAETFCADLRIHGRQRREARIRILASLLAYGYGFTSAALGLPPAAVAAYKLVNAVVLSVGSLRSLERLPSIELFTRRARLGLRPILAAATALAAADLLGMAYNKANVFFLQAAAGTRGVGLYSATWNIVDAVPVLVSQQFLGWVVFPVLAVLWARHPERALALVRTCAGWLLVAAAGLAFLLYQESDLMVGLLYPDSYAEAASLQKRLVWAIPLSFEHNLFVSLMIVAGALRPVVAVAATATVVNLILNLTLVGPGGLEGACQVIVFTKLVAASFTAAYCQRRFRLFGWREVAFLSLLCVCACGLFLLLDSALPHHASVVTMLAAGGLALWLFGRRWLGSLRGMEAPASEP